MGGLSAEELERATGLLGRRPGPLEEAVIAAMWSEHCAYVSTRALLDELPTCGARVRVGPGENAGVVDIGDGLCLAFKVESHNHPSAIDPVQGAATGVGGIIRDVLVMGARPMVLLNSLRFGGLEGRSLELLRGVVEGIAGYGNCVGLPDVGGELRFDPSYADNPLVNVFCAGLVPRDRLCRGAAMGEGNGLWLLGRASGRDGLHGATMASGVFSSAEAPPPQSVQRGDPFAGRLLIDGCLALLDAGLVLGMQDLGAAGLTSASVEMAERGGVGLVLTLDAVPQAEAGLGPEELLLGETQERALVVVSPEQEALLVKICEEHGLAAARVGEVRSEPWWRARWRGEEVAALPVSLLTSEAPLMERPWSPPADLALRQRLPTLPALLPGGAARALLELMAGPELCDRSWIWRQLDHEVGAETLVGPGQDAAVLGVRGTSIQLAFVMSGDARLVGQDPRLGVQHLLASALRRLSCVGARPIGITDGLNHGDPRRPEVMWELREVIGGLGEAAAALEVPVVSGNVSLYNETDGRGVRPTPILGVVGRREGPFRRLSAVFLPGLEVALLGDVGEGWLGASLFAAAALGEQRGRPSPVDLPFERELAERVCQLYDQGLLLLAHDVGEGGLGCALAELCMGGTGGCFDLPGEGPLAARLFGEDAGRVLVAYAPEHREAVGGLVLGQTGGPRLQIGPVVVDVEELRRAWASTLPALLEAGDGG